MSDDHDDNQNNIDDLPAAPPLSEQLTRLRSRRICRRSRSWRRTPRTGFSTP